MDLKKTGQFILELRKKKGFTQVELGEQIGVTGKAVSKWENGQSLPDVSILNSLSTVLEVTVTELLNGDYIDIKNQETIDDVTEGSINLYQKEEKKKFNTIIIILLVIILSLVAIILAIFMYNNYNSCQIYSVKSQNSEIQLTGVLNITNKKNLLMINNLKYSGTNIHEVQMINFRLESESIIYYQSGELESNANEDFNMISFNDCLKNISIYISEEEDGLQLGAILNDKLSIVIDYLDYNKVLHHYTIPISLKREFSNSKLIY